MANKAKTPVPKKQNVVSKRKAKKNYKLLIEANTLFIEHTKLLSENYELNEQDQENNQQLITHLTNLNGHFYEIVGTIK